jgi:TP901 family phage tail tape measure protein
MDAAELVVRITGDIDDIESKLRRTTQAASSFGESMERTGRNISAAGRSMTTGFTVPLVALGGFALKSAVDFETAFAGVRKTVNATEEEFAALESGVRNMAKTIPASAEEIAKVAESAGQLGIKKEAILGFTRTMVDLGVATNMSSDEAATALARLANITQMPQDQFDRLGATVVHLGNNLATTEAEIVEFSLRIAGAGNVVGMTEHEIMAFAGAMSSLGINAEAGGTAISRAFIKIAKAVDDGGAELDAFAEVAGMSSAKFATAFKDNAAGAMTTFIEGLGRVQESGGSLFQVLEDLGMEEIRLRDSMLRLAGGGDILRDSLEMAAFAWDDNTALATEAGRRYETTASKLAMFWNRVKDAAMTLGAELVPALLGAMEAAEPLGRFAVSAVQWFGSLPGPVKTVVIALAGLVAIAGPILVAVGAVITAIGAIAPVVTAVAGFISAPVLGIVALIVGIGVAAYALWRNWDTVWGWITGAAGTAAAWIVDRLGLILGPIGWIVSAALWLWRNWDEVTQLVTGATGALASWIGDRVSAIVGWLAALPGRAWGAAASFIDRMWDLAYQAMAGMASNVNDGIADLVAWFGEMPGRIVDAIGNVAGLLYDIGASIIQGLWDGMLGVWRRVTGWVSGIAGWIRDNKGPITTDRVLLEPAGTEIIGGLLRAMQNEEARLMAYLHGLTADIAATVSIAPAPAPTPVAAAGIATGTDARVVALLEELIEVLKEHKGIEMTFNTPVDPLHVAREVAWAAGGGD